MTDRPDPGEFTDVTDAAGEDWESETTPYERVRQVIRHTYTGVSAETVANEARTSPKTARKHLDTLADEGFVTTEPGDHGGTHYCRSPTSLVAEQAADILDHTSREELIDRITTMRARLEELRSTYDVDSPEAVAVEQASQTLTDDSSPESAISTEELREWQTTRRNLAFATAALSIANAERFVDEGAPSPDEHTPVQ